MIDRIARPSALAISVLLAGLGPAAVASGQLDNGAQVNVDALGRNILGDAANEPSIAVNPLDPREIVIGWREFPSVNSSFRRAGYAWSSDRGLTWTNGGVIDLPPDGQGGQQSDPVLSPDREGVIHYNSLIFGSSTGDGQVTYPSFDAGRTWGDPGRITSGFADKNWYLVDRVNSDGNHYCTWGNFFIFFTRSTDGGRTWAQERILDFGSDGLNISSHLNVGPDGELYVAWWNYEAGEIELVRSDDAGDAGSTPTFGSVRSIRDFGDWPFGVEINPDGGAGQVWVEVDRTPARRGWVYLVSSAIVPGDPCDVRFSRSRDGGVTFSEPIRVNDDPVGNGEWQWMAAASMAPETGRLDVFWLDTRDDPGLDSRLYYTYSYDGGTTWAPDRPLTEAFDPTLGYPVQRKIGDYFQSVSDSSGVNVVYPATFNGEQDLYFLRVAPFALEVETLVAGGRGIISVSGGKPDAATALAYTTAGFGRTFIPAAGVTLDLASPRQAGPLVTTDASGSATFDLPVPEGTAGTVVSFQAVQFENASAVGTAVVTE